MYIELATGRYPVSENDIRAEHPNVSFPTVFQGHQGFAWVFPTPKPEFDPITQSCTESAPSHQNGMYFQSWSVSNIYGTTEEAEAASIAATAEKISSLRASKLHSASQRCDSAMAELEKDYPQSEIKSWAKQEAEALSITNQTGSPTPLLAVIAAERGIALGDLADKVLAKAAVFASAAGQIIGQRQAVEAAIMAATTVTELEAIEC